MLRRRGLFPRYTPPPPTKIIFTLGFQVLSVSCGWRWELSPRLFCLFKANAPALLSSHPAQLHSRAPPSRVMRVELRGEDKE